MGSVIFILLLIFGGLYLYGYFSNEQKKIDEEQRIKNFLKSNNAPLDCKWFSYISGHPYLKGPCNLYVWRDDESLNLLSETETHKIPLDAIKYYSIKGDIRQETEYKGKGMSTTDTMITEGLFGTAAAMKRNQATPIIKTIDERRTIINADIEGKNCFIFFKKGDLYNYLLEHLPEKEQSFVTMQ
jgi:hypothetical protein